jgi:3-mercaptopyruvate sulfurtransferase SseA
VSGGWSAWQAARVEVKQDQEAKKQKKQDLPSEVVDALIERTTVDSANAAG